MTRTTEGIFTSIIHMGIQDQDPTEQAPDYGCQYELRILENSLIQIFATDGPEPTAHQVVVKQAKGAVKKSIQSVDECSLWS